MKNAESSRAKSELKVVPVPEPGNWDKYIANEAVTLPKKKGTQPHRLAGHTKFWLDKMVP